MSKVKISDGELKQINNNPKKFAEKASIKDLTRILKRISYVYYNTGESLVSDEIYDILKETLVERDPENPFLAEIGSPIEGNRVKVQLPYPMGSLSKIKPEKENLDAWLSKYKGPYVLSDKLDGTSAQFYKESETDFKLYSRGNGIEGQDISHLIKIVVPRTVKRDNIPVGASIRGEIIISKEDFKKIEGVMKNARNASSGVVNSKTVDLNVAKLCQFVAYSILEPAYKQDEQMRLLREYGFNVVNYKIARELNYQMLSDYLIDRRKNSEFEVDGIVVFDSGKAYPHKSGNPEHGFAFKTVLQDQIAETKIKKVDWYPSMDGYLKPTIEIEPVELGGTTVVHATAFNAKFVVDNKLGPGAVVKIIRSGDVIPYILEVVKPAKEAQLPNVSYAWNNTGVDIILKDLYGAQADAITIRLISHFFKTLGVDFIGEGIVTKFVNAGYKTIPSIINALKNKKDQLSEIEGIGMKLIDKIWIGLENALSNTDLTILMAASHSFGRGFGVRKIREITNEYPDILSLEWNVKTMKEKIEQIRGFSSTTASQFAENFAKFRKLYKEINKIVDISHLEEAPAEDEEQEQGEKQGKKNDLQGKSFVFTGFRDKELEDEIANRGGRVSGSVSSKTTAVVKADESEDKSSKVKEAEKKKVPIIDRSQFLREYKIDLKA
jgi:DNA ligase (NAD+)